MGRCPWLSATARLGLILGGILLGSTARAADDSGWIALDDSLEHWKKPHGTWFSAMDATLDPKNKRLFVGTPGTGVWVNGPKGNTNNLVSKNKFGDVELQLEFKLSQRSNSGIKFHAHYEIQLYDSHGAKKMSGSDCGGIYPRAEIVPRYHHIDKGIAPLTNACREPGAWQKLHVIFLAPRFDGEGKKIANARIVKAVLNDVVVQDNVELQYPTGHAWKNREMAQGPLLIQADHGPVAYRGVRIRPYKP